MLESDHQPPRPSWPRLRCFCRSRASDRRPQAASRGAHGTTTTGDEAEGRPNRIRGGSTRPRNSNRTRVGDTAIKLGKLLVGNGRKVERLSNPSTFEAWDSDQDAACKVSVRLRPGSRRQSCLRFKGMRWSRSRRHAPPDTIAGWCGGRHLLDRTFDADNLFGVRC